MRSSGPGTVRGSQSSRVAGRVLPVEVIDTGAPIAPAGDARVPPSESRRKMAGGILKAAAPRRGGASRNVRWKPVLVANEDRILVTQAPEEDDDGTRKRKNPCSVLASLVTDMRIWLLTYELVMIPIRFAFPLLVLTPIAVIVLDLAVDVMELLLNEVIIVRASLPVLVHGSQSRAVEDSDATMHVAAYSQRRAALDILTILVLHIGRVVYFIYGSTGLWVYGQIVRSVRVLDLMSHVQVLNSDLSANVTFLAIFKFTAVLLSVPHWMACFWIVTVDGWKGGVTQEVTLPEWPAQMFFLAGNPTFEPNSMTYGERYLAATYMAYSGLTAFGYELVLTRAPELVLALVCAFIQLIFYAFVLGTLFHYLVRTDENTVAFKVLLKAVDEFALERKLPPALTVRITSHFRFQHSKQSSATANIFAQMPRTLQTEVASEQYSREMTSTWVFFGCTPQFLNSLVLHVRERFMTPRELLFKRGDGALELLWCVGGTLHVKKGDVLISTIRADFGAGQVVGEIAFFAGIPQPYTVQASASGEVTLVVLPASGYEEIVSSYPEQLDTITHTVLRKFGLDKNGGDVAMGGALVDGARDKEEQEEFDELRETIRKVIIERNSERLAQMSSAVASGDLESINALCAAGFDINLGNYDHQTALHLAARVGNASVTSLLIDHSANVNAVDRWRSTPIKVAIDSQHGAVAEVLQAHGAVLKLNNPARRILDAVRRTDINYLQMLITAGVDVNSVDYDLRTGLHIAAAEGNLRMAEYLIVALADVNAADRWGRTPCDDAFEAEEMVVMQLMLRASARPNLVALAPKLRAAAACADTRKLQFLVDIGIGVQDICMASPHYDGRTALHHAVRCGSLTATYQLVMAMMDVNQRDSWGRTALNDALSISSEIAALLLRAGATLPPPYCDDAELQARVELASKVNMYQVMGEIARRSEMRRDQQVSSNVLSRELEITCTSASGRLVELGRTRASILRMLRGRVTIWLTSYADEDESNGTSHCSGSHTSGSDDLSDEDDADQPTPFASAPLDGESAARRFLRAMLQLPKTAQALHKLREHFNRRFALAQLVELSEAARRSAEHDALGHFLVEDLLLMPHQAEAVKRSLYAELTEMVDMRAVASELAAAGRASAGPGAPAQPWPSAHLKLMVTPTARASFARDSPSALVDLCRFINKEARQAFMPRRSIVERRGLSQLPFDGADTTPPVAVRTSSGGGKLGRERPGSARPEPPSQQPDEGLVPLFLSDIGYCALFASATLFELLALNVTNEREASDDASGPLKSSSQSFARTDSPDVRTPLFGRRLQARLADRTQRSSAETESPMPGGPRARNGGRWTKLASAVGAPDSPSTPPLTPTASGSRRSSRKLERFGSVVSQLMLRQPRSPLVGRRQTLERVDAPGSAAAGPPNASDGGGRPSDAAGSGPRWQRPTIRRSANANAPPRAQALGVCDEAWLALASFVEIFDAQKSGFVQLGTVHALRRGLGEMGVQEVVSLHQHLNSVARALVRVGGRAAQSPSRRGSHGGGSPRAAQGDALQRDTPGASARQQAPSPAACGASPVASASTLLRLGAPTVGDGKAGGGAVPQIVASVFDDSDDSDGDERAPRPRGAVGGAAETADSASARARRSSSGSAGSGDGGSNAAGRESTRQLELSHAESSSVPGSFRHVRLASMTSAPVVRKRSLSTNEFMLGVTGWISSVADDGDGDGEDARGSGGSDDSEGEGGDGMRETFESMDGDPVVLRKLDLATLRAMGGGSNGSGARRGSLREKSELALASSLEAERRRKGGGGGSSSAGRRGRPSARRSTLADATMIELEAALAAPQAYAAVIDLIRIRINIGRIRENELADADELARMLAHCLSVPLGMRSSHVAAFCSVVLGCDLKPQPPQPSRRSSTAAALAAPTAAVDLDADAPTWCRLIAAMEGAADDLADRKRSDKTVESAANAAADVVAKQAGNDLSSKPWFILSMRSRAHRVLHVGYCLLVTFDLCLLPMMLTFLPASTQIAWFPGFMIAADIVYVLFILLRFNTSYVNSKSVEVLEPRACRRAYLATAFALDAIALIPLNYAALAAGATPLMVAAFRMLRLIYVRYPVREYVRWSRALADDDLFNGMLAVLGWLFVTLHVLTCVYQAIGPDLKARMYGPVVGQLLDSPAGGMAWLTWDDIYMARRLEINGGSLSDFASPERTVAENYVVSLFAIVQLLTTMGSNQLPANMLELGFYCFVLLLNLTIYAWIVGQLSSLVMKQDDEVISKRAQLELVNAYIASIRVPKELKQRLTKFFRARLKSKSLSSVHGDTIYQGLPAELQIEVSGYTNRSVVEAAVLLQGCSAGYVDRVSSLLSERTPDPEAIIYRTAEACKELIFIAQGAIEVYSDGDGDGTDLEQMRVHGVGDTLGDVAFIFNIRHVDNARAAPDVTTKIFVLVTRAWSELLKTFPGQEDIIMENAITSHEGASLMTSRSGKSRNSSAGSRVSDEELRSLGERSATQGSNGQENDDRLQAVVAAAKEKRTELYRARLCSACARGEHDEVNRLLRSTAVDVNTTGADRRTPLHLAATSGNVKLVELLIFSRADVNAQDLTQSTPLMSALASDHPDTAKLIAKHGGGRGSADVSGALCEAVRRPDATKAMLALSNYGGNLNAQTVHRRTALHVAAAEGHLANVEYLLQSGASPNLRDHLGVTPRPEAVRSRRDACADALVAAGGDLGDFDMAVELNNAVLRNDTVHLSRLIRCRCDLNSHDDYRRTALHVAVSCKRATAAHFLLEQAGINVNAEDVFGHTPLDDALRAEAGLSTQVLVVLVTASGGVRGSDVSSLEANQQSARFEENRIAESNARLAARQNWLVVARQMESWAHEEAEAASAMRATISAALKLEREQGQVLADAMPDLWSKLNDYATAQRCQHESAVSALDVVHNDWHGSIESATDASRDSIRILAQQLERLVSSHEDEMQRGDNPLDRLAEATFRKPLDPPAEDGAVTFEGSSGGGGEVQIRSQRFSDKPPHIDVIRSAGSSRRNSGADGDSSGKPSPSKSLSTPSFASARSARNRGDALASEPDDARNAVEPGESSSSLSGIRSRVGL